jgi:hypothetical protein
MPIRFRCTKCAIELSGDAASRHCLMQPTHRLVKLPSIAKPKRTP